MAHRFIAYYRVSRAKQGVSRLGLEAQQRAVADYVASQRGELIETFEEVESGKRDDRPALAKAMDLCDLTGARLLIAKIDRLSRDLHFTTGLQRRGVDFVACDMPDANTLTINILVAVAQQEREAISARTKAGLASINARLAAGLGHVSQRSGRIVTKLGNPQGLTVSRPDLGVAAIKAKADGFAAKVAPRVREMRAEGLAFAAIADRLNTMRVRTARGSTWTPMAVKRVLDRAV
jgi:DNA invertase Pin-like site-specific DNA recombinase